MEKQACRITETASASVSTNGQIAGKASFSVPLYVKPCPPPYATYDAKPAGLIDSRVLKKRLAVSIRTP